MQCPIRINLQGAGGIMQTAIAINADRCGGTLPDNIGVQSFTVICA
jgi:hypothetical protein